jgi:DUF1365 family protein
MNVLQHAPDLRAPPAAEIAAVSAKTFASAIYEGWVRHRRYKPHAHDFSYKMCMLYIDLAELNQLFLQSRFWSVGEKNIAEFRRSDYLGAAEIPLDQAVRERVFATTGNTPRGPIRLLTHLRYFGHCFNPVSFYYCFAEDGQTLQTIVAEITNTPWKERHAYVLDVMQAEQHRNVFSWNFAKAFHVSPFIPMQRDYRWRFSIPDDALRVNMDVLKDGASDFDATLVLQKKPLNARNLTSCLLRFPLMTMKIVAAIHWQAFIIFLRRNPVYSHSSSAPAQNHSDRNP